VQLVSGSFDKLIKIWNYTNGNCLKTLNGHKGNIYSLIKINENQFLSGGADKSIKMWSV